MNSSSYDLHTSTDITLMSEAILENNSNQPLIKTTDNDQFNEEKQLLSNEDNRTSNSIDNVPIESSLSNITQKHKSLISVYDNSNDGEQPPQQQQQQEEINGNTFPLVGILGRNQRSQAFRKRLLLSGFPNPILYDINSNEIDLNNPINSVSYEIFHSQSPSIILITDNLPNNFENIFHFNQQQLIIDVREIIYSKNSSNILFKISNCYQAFGNLSNWEIEYGTQRIGVAVEQSSPIDLIKFIYNLNCFLHGFYFVDQYTYNNKQRKSFHYCLFPFLSTIIIFCFWFILSLIEYHNKYEKSIYQIDIFYRQASSICAATSITLLSLLFLIRPLIELIEFFLKKFHQNKQEKFILQWKFFQYWLYSRRYLAWYSLLFAFLHFIFLLFIKNNFNEKTFFYPIPTLFGLITLVILILLSCIYFPWISERLLWYEYHLLTTYLGSFILLIAFIHVFIHWKYDYYHTYTYNKRLFQLKFLSIFLPFLVILLRFILYGLIYPIKKLFQLQHRTIQTKKDISFLT